MHSSLAKSTLLGHPRPRRRTISWALSLAFTLGFLAASACSSDEPGAESINAGTTGGAAACGGGLSQCAEGCVDLASNPANCGGCGAACSSGQACQNSSCQCVGGLSLCGAACVETQSDAANCGVCGTVCDANTVCSLGACSAGCDAGLEQCGQNCVDTMTSPLNCGACGTACAGGATCIAGTCTCATAGQTLCAGTCVDTSTSNAHCGACDNACPMGEVCSGSVCVSGATTSGATTSTGTSTSTSSGGTTTTSAGGSSSTSDGSTTTDGASTTGQVVSGDFTIDLSLSDVIQTVGIVEWSSTQTIDSAHIDFGRESGNYELSAPVDLNEPNNRTLLLGMKENTTYYVQLFAESGGTTLSSEVLTLDTGALPDTTPVVTVNDVSPEALYGAFTINCTGAFGNQSGSVAFIFDQDGDAVWAYDLAGTDVEGCSRARMSYDGKDMWVGNFSNVSPDGALMRLSMDGITSRFYSLPGRNHDFAVLPNNNILYQEQANGGMGRGGADEGNDYISELDVESGETRILYDENTDFSEQIAESGAHTNYVEYVPHLNGISFSMRHTSTIGVISYPAPGEEAQLLMTFGGPLSDFDFSWEFQHGHELLENSILIFNNTYDGSFGTSALLEYQYDLAAGTGTLVLDYHQDGLNSAAFGDVQRLPNGNTLVTYSTSGVIHEIDSEGNLLREMSTDQIGYSQHRKTLYGPPPTFTRGN